MPSKQKIDIKAEDYYESAMRHFAMGDKPAAIMQLQEALLLRPDYAEAWNNRGNILLQLGHPFDAMMNYEKAILAKPGNAEFHNNHGTALAGQHKYKEALVDYDKAIDLNPDVSVFYTNKADMVRLLDQWPLAIECYRKAIELDPKNADAHLRLGMALLRDGQLGEGWREFEWRWQSQLPPRGLSIPQWEGQPLEGKKLLIYSEQGHGDTIQFIRCAPLVKQKFGGEIFVEVRAALTRIVKTVAGIDTVLTFGDKIPDGIDYCTPMMTLPLLLGINTEADIPWNGPYFTPNPERVVAWRERLAKLPHGKLLVGVCWAGMSREHQPTAAMVDRQRSMTLAQFAPLGLVPGVAWVSLQKGPPSEQVTKPPRGMTIGDWMEEADDFYDTVALVAPLDLVITVDTAVAHLAAALGKPVWLLSRYDNCWRWMGHRKDSPWYPTLKQYCQPAPTDWDPVMEEVALDLREFVKENSEKAA